MIINLFCDASIDVDRKIACAGCYIVVQGESIHSNPLPLYYKMYIQHNATNNSAEILAIWAGVTEAIKLRQSKPNATFRLFSDSKISLYGLRDWIKNWIKNSENANTNVLISSVGQPVANQQCFIDIFNLIVESGLKIELYHQRGHVGGSGPRMDKARVQFIRANKVPPESLGLDFDFLCQCNNYIDISTRSALRKYIDNGFIDYETTSIIGINPMHFYIRSNMIHQYIRNINKTSVSSHHDFKGGYSQ